ncbi:MAG: hypothetical protein ACREA0_05255 [bacterium]
MNKQVRFTTALALGVAVLSIPALGYAQPPTVAIGPTASLVGKGVGAIVSVDFTCDSLDPNDRTFLGVEILQRTGRGTTFGAGSLSGFECDSTSQSVEVFVSTFGRPFKAGLVGVRAFLQACLPDFSVCEEAQTGREARLVR